MITVTYKNVLISLIMMAAITAAVWMTLSFNRISNPLPEKTNSLPDALMEEVSAIIMDKQGKPKMKIVSPKVSHYAEHDITDFISPHITLYRQHYPTPWYVTSQHAKAIQGIDHINFWQEVVIHHAADLSQPATLIQTNTLTVYPQQQTAETIDSITLTQPNLVVKAKGMHADLNTGSIKLLSDARGEYVPT